MKLRPLSVFFLALIYFLVLSLVPDKKLIVLVCGIAAGYLYIRLKDFAVVVTLLYVMNVPFVIGKKWNTDLVAMADVDIYGRPFGLASEFTLTLSLGMIAVMAVLVMIRILTGCVHPEKRDAVFAAFWVLPVSMLLATFIGSVFRSVSIFHVLPYVAPLCVYLFMKYVRPAVRYQQVLGAFAAIVCAEAGLTLLQHIKGGGLGLVIEEFPQHMPIDLSTDASADVLTRFGGTFAHANNLGDMLSFVVPLFLPYLFLRGRLEYGLYRIAFFVGMAALYLSQSRSAWLSVFVAVLVWIFIVEKVWKQRLRLWVDWTPKLVGVSVIMGMLGLLLVFPRLGSTVHTFASMGSGETRWLLLQEAFRILPDRWIAGVGLDLDAYYTYTRSKAIYFRGAENPSVMSYFPEPVHNGLLRLLIQTGIVGFIPYMIAVWLFIRHRRGLLRRSGQMRFAGLAFLTAVLGWYTNSMLQPLLPELHLVVAVGMILENASPSA